MEAKQEAARLWAAARAAARALEGVPYARIALGCRLPEAVIEELAALAGTTVGRTVHVGANAKPPYVIHAIHAHCGDVAIDAQGDRPATAADVALGGHWGSDCRTLEPGSDEVRAALGVAS